jgi:DNA-binding LacI/PurR family transcriptional regulator
MAVTIKDVAEAAGVSISTVSYTLNNTGPVSEEKKQRILEAVKALGYVPNGMAKSLKSRKNGFIGYFAHSLYGVVYGEVLRGIENEMDRNGQEMIAAKCGPMQDITHISRLLMERSHYLLGDDRQRAGESAGQCPLSGGGAGPGTGGPLCLFRSD